MFRSPQIDRVLSLAFLASDTGLNKSDYYSGVCCEMRWHYHMASLMAQEATSPDMRHMPRVRPQRGRRAWDTDAFRLRAVSIHKILCGLNDAEPGDDNRDLILPADFIRSWRFQRICRRYPEIQAELDKMLQSIPCLPSSVPASPSASYADIRSGRHEAQDERKTRHQINRALHKGGDSLAERTAMTIRSHGTFSAAADREADAIARAALVKRDGLQLIALGLWWKNERTASVAVDRDGEVDQYICRGPKSGRSPSKEPFLINRRYPKTKAIKRWTWIMDRGPFYWIYGETPAQRDRRLQYSVNRSIARRFEIVTPETRKARSGKRLAKATVQIAADMAKTPAGLEALRALVAQAMAMVK